MASYRKPADEVTEKDMRFRFYISSAELDSAQFAHAVRAHWGIENQLHWVLDVALREDECGIYRENSAENLAGIRHIAVNLLKQERAENAVSRPDRGWRR